MRTLFFVFIFTLTTSTLQSDFLSDQKKYPRVRVAISEKEETIKARLAVFDIELNELNILLVAYKEEKTLDLFAKSKTSDTFELIETYNVCANSGVLGPKRKQGDYQVPEGFYYVDRFNPASNFYLSLGLNYPNDADRKKSSHENLGGDIFIHGSCVTIGCLPMTDDIIKELYTYAIHARNNNQKKIPVYVFPFKMTEENITSHLEDQAYNKCQAFWRNLQEGYLQFARTKQALNVRVGKNGDYLF